MKKLKFWKLEGAGNDFVLFDVAPSRALLKMIPSLCQAHSGVGADGVVFTWKKAGKFPREWRFFNADGSETSACGNAARCVGRWLELRKEGKGPEWTWRGKLGLFRARRGSARRGKQKTTEVTWPLPTVSSHPLSEDLLDLLSGYNTHGFAGVFRFTVGVPHVVLLNHEVWNFEERLATNPILRSHRDLGEEGANITWVSLKTGEAVTFERGVERETQACGTGAFAAFLGLEALRQESDRSFSLKEHSFRFPGGTLTVKRDRDGALWLGGPANLVFTGELPS